MELENKDLEKGIVVELNKYREFPASRTMQLHKNKVADGFELIPVIKDREVIAVVSWTGNLWRCEYDENYEDIRAGQGLIRMGEFLILTTIHELRHPTADIVSVEKALELIVSTKSYKIIDQLYLQKEFESMLEKINEAEL